MVPMADGPSHLHRLDWAILSVYLAAVIATGIVFSWKKRQNTEDYFLAGRRMPRWAVATSMIATAISAATFIGLPAQSYQGDLTFLSASLGQLIAAFLVGLLFLPAFFRHNVSSVYQLLAVRFGPPAQLTASGFFLLGRVLADGARIYIASLAVAMILTGPAGDSALPSRRDLFLAAALLVGVGITYTLVGGVSSVIWTNVVQAFVFLLALLATLWLLLENIPLSWTRILEVLSHPANDQPSKLAVLTLGLDRRLPNWGFNPAQTYTLLTALVPFTLFNMAAYGTDHELAQRLLTCSSASKSSQSLVSAALMGIPITALFLVIGLLLYVYYAAAPPEILEGNSGPPKVAKTVFLHFILYQMPPGLVGICLAGLFASALSSVNSSLNAMSATFVTDFYHKWQPNRTEEHYVAAGRWAIAGWGVAQLGMAGACILSQDQDSRTLIDLALGVMTFAYAGLLAAFLTAILTRRGNNTSVILAMFCGFGIVLIFQPLVWESIWTRLSAVCQTLGIPPTWPNTLSRWQLAYPWWLTIATSIALVVACAGRSCGTPPSQSTSTHV